MTELIKSKKQRRDKDNYPTPVPIARWVVEHCVKLTRFGEAVSFLEPGCGDNAPFAADDQKFWVVDHCLERVS